MKRELYRVSPHPPTGRVALITPPYDHLTVSYIGNKKIVPCLRRDGVPFSSGSYRRDGEQSQVGGAAVLPFTDGLRRP